MVRLTAGHLLLLLEQFLIPLFTKTFPHSFNPYLCAVNSKLSI
jgi:hypothetical protein